MMRRRLRLRCDACGLQPFSRVRRTASGKITLKIKDFSVYLELQKKLGEAIRAVLKEKYELEGVNVPLETPPDLRFGEVATPVAFELARKLRKAPKVIAQEIVAALGTREGFAGFEAAGSGYINAKLDRAVCVRHVAFELETIIRKLLGSGPTQHALVEHTSINPNKAAHVGHLRNAILGDTFVRLLRAAGQKVDVQNYIDNTGVQVADVVVGFLHLEQSGVPGVSADEQHTLVGIRKLMVYLAQEVKANPSNRENLFDYYCWYLYARVNTWYLGLQDPSGFGDPFQANDELVAKRKQIRLDVLHKIEEGNNEIAAIAELVSTAVLKRHLETMLRLDIEYDLLPRESEILHLKFWDAAFEQLKKTGVLYFENEGKNKGCWVMTRPGAKTGSIRSAGLQSGCRGGLRPAQRGWRSGLRQYSPPGGRRYKRYR